MTYQTIRLAIDPRGVARLVLARPEKHNAMNAAMIRELTGAARSLAADPACRVVVLSADGASFCAGGDLGWMKDQFEAAGPQRAAEALALALMLDALDGLPQLVIAQVQGAAYGGGVGLISISDLVIASQAAKFALTETRLGLIPATIAPYVHRKVGAAAMRRIGLHGPALDAAAAARIGLVDETVADLDAAVEAHVALALACAPGAVAEAKRLFRQLAAGEAADTVAALARRWDSAEARAGIGAFFAKSQPPWRS